MSLMKKKDEIILNPENTAYYPKSKDLIINSSDLKIKFMEFKNAVQNTVNWTTITSLVALWVPVFTSDFKPLFNLTSQSVGFGYLIFAFISSLIIVRPTIITMTKYILVLFNGNSKYGTKYEVDPEKKVEQIIKEELNK